MSGITLLGIWFFIYPLNVFCAFIYAHLRGDWVDGFIAMFTLPIFGPIATVVLLTGIADLLKSPPSKLAKERWRRGLVK